jgi:hypothetical protein
MLEKVEYSLLTNKNVSLSNGCSYSSMSKINGLYRKHIGRDLGSRFGRKPLVPFALPGEYVHTIFN